MFFKKKVLTNQEQAVVDRLINDTKIQWHESTHHDDSYSCIHNDVFIIVEPRVVRLSPLSENRHVIKTKLVHQALKERLDQTKKSVFNRILADGTN